MKSIKTFNDIVKTNGDNFNYIKGFNSSLVKKNQDELDKEFNRIPYWVYLTFLTYGTNISSLFDTVFLLMLQKGFEAKIWLGLNKRYNLDEKILKELGDETLIDSVKFVLYACSKENILLEENEYKQWKQVGLSNNTMPVQELSARGLDNAIVMSQNISNNQNEREMMFSVKYLLMSFLKDIKNRKLESVINCDNQTFYKIFNKVIDDSKLSKNTAGHFPLLFTSLIDYKKNENALSDILSNFINEKYREMSSTQASYYKSGAAEKIFLAKVIDFFQGSWVAVKKLKDTEFEKMFVNELGKAFLLLDELIVSCEDKTQGIQNSIKTDIDKFEAYFLRESEKRESLKSIPRLSENKEDFSFGEVFTSFTLEFEDDKWRNFQKNKYKKAVKGGTYSRLIENLEKLDLSGFLNINNTHVMIKNKKIDNEEVRFCSVTVTSNKNEDLEVFKAKVAATFELFIKMDQKDFDQEVYASMEDHLIMRFDAANVQQKRKIGVKF